VEHLRTQCIRCVSTKWASTTVEDMRVGHYYTSLVVFTGETLVVFKMSIKIQPSRKIYHTVFELKLNVAHEFLIIS